MENQKNEELAIYCVVKGSNELYPSIALSLEKADIVASYYENINLTRDDYEKVTDLVKIKNSLYYENEAQGIYSFEEYADFTKKVDEKLIEHICDKFYSGYENCEADQRYFRDSKIAYDDNGFIEKIQAIGDGNWLDIKALGELNDLDEVFKNKYLQKSQNDFLMSIKISPVGEFDETTKKLFEEHNLFDKIWQKNEATAMLQLLGKLDDKINETALANNTIPNSKLHFEMLTDKNEQVDVNVPLGRNLFKNGDINKLINYSRNDLKLNQVSQDTADKIKALMATNEKGEYVKKIDNHIIENMFNGGMAGLAKSAESIGDEHLTAFVQGFANAYGFGKVAPTEKKVFVKNNKQKKSEISKKPDDKSNENKAETTKQPNNQSNEKNTTQEEREAVRNEVNEVGSKIVSKDKNEKQISKPTDKSR